MLFEILFLTHIEQRNARYAYSVDLRYPGNEECHSNIPGLKLSQHSDLIRFQ
jgi:hypothetical protein